jgi:kynurenine 3-monooxygenase
VLMDLAEKNGVTIRFNEKYSGGDLKSELDLKSGAITFGADGAFSAVRLQMQQSMDRFDYRQYYQEHGYKELCIPPTASGDFAMDPAALHIWPRGNFMLIALPNLDKSFTCTLFFPFEGEYSFSALNTREKMLRFFQKTFPDAAALMPGLEHDYFTNPSSSLMTVKCFPWSFQDKLLLIGDAAHAIVPFYGQGMNCGFEDCVVLDQLMDKHGEDWAAVFRDFENQRKQDSDAIADMAISNFIEMRDKVADPKFLLQKKIEARFSASHPDKWTPLYTMVTYSPHIRYSTALKEGQKQERWKWNRRF